MNDVSLSSDLCVSLSVIDLQEQLSHQLAGDHTLRISSKAKQSKEKRSETEGANFS